LTEVREQMVVKTRELHDIMGEAGPDVDLSRVTLLPGNNDYKDSEIKRRHAELSAIGAEEDRLRLLEEIATATEQRYKAQQTPVGGMVFPGQSTSSNGVTKSWEPPKSLHDQITTSPGFKEFKAGQLSQVTLALDATEFKTLITLANIYPQVDRQATVDMALEERTVADLMNSSNTTGNTVEYFEETLVTNAATTVAEGAPKPESALGWTLRTEPIRKIATWIPATSESLDDVGQLEADIRGRLAFMIRRIEEAQILSGNGVGQNLTGLLNRPNIQTQAKGTDPNPDAIYKAMQKIRGSAGQGFAEPTAVVVNPADWTLIKLLRTTDGIYLWGNPSDEGPDRIWGKPVRQTTAMAQGTALVGAFRPWAEVVRRQAITVTLSTEHASYFIENKVAILAEERIGLKVMRPSAFCTVTGIV
jgi:hypothetical protein